MPKLLYVLEMHFAKFTFAQLVIAKRTNTAAGSANNDDSDPGLLVKVERC